MSMSDVADALLYLFGFWRFVLSKQFRRDCLSRFRRMSGGSKALELLNALVSTAIGLGVPFLFVYVVLSHRFGLGSVDTCLDSGGSYDYIQCECDYGSNHPVLEDHEC